MSGNMLQSKNQTTHGTPSSRHCRPLVDALHRCKTLADLKAIVLAAAIDILVKGNAVRVTRRRGAKKRATEATQTLAHPCTDKANSAGDTNATPAVPKDRRDDASENNGSEQQQNADQSRAQPTKNVRDYAAVASERGQVTTAPVRATKEEVTRRRRLKQVTRKREQPRSKSDAVHEYHL